MSKHFFRQQVFWLANWFFGTHGTWLTNWSVFFFFFSSLNGDMECKI